MILVNQHNASAAEMLEGFAQENHSNPRTPPCPLETSRGEHFMKCRFASARIRGGTMKKPYTDKQGQYLAFIYYYGKNPRTGRLPRPKCSNNSRPRRLPCIG